MSFGDPNNPYGHPQGQQPPGYGAPQPPQYGYPQQQPQQQPPGHGYPQAPPLQQHYGGVPMTTMPGSVGAARVMLWVVVGLQVIGVALLVLAALALNAAKDDKALRDDVAFQDLVGDSTALLWGYTLFGIAWAVFAIVLATKFTSGGNGVRVTVLVFGTVTAVLGIYPFVLIGLVHTVLGVLIAVFAGNAAGKAWFNRPRY